MQSSSSIMLFFHPQDGKRVPTPHDFFKEVRYITQSICVEVGYWGPPEDVIQNFYLNKILSKNILAKYDPKKAKMSTWLYRILHNLVIGHMATESLNKHYESYYFNDADGRPMFNVSRAETKHAHYSRKGFKVVSVEATKEALTVDGPYCGIDPDYNSIAQRNANSDDPEGLLFQLKNFETVFLRTKEGTKRHNFDRRKNPKPDTNGGTLLDLFHMFYEGFTSHEIALKYGVTDMTVCHMKHKLAETLRRYGFEPTNTSGETVEAELLHA